MAATRTIYRGRLIGLGALIAVVSGCSATSSEGNPSVGGSVSNGGSPTAGAANGGATAAGGNATGGSITGGAAPTGGEPATGGAIGVGGAPPTGGAMATGGAETGGAAMATGGKAAGTGGGPNATGGKAAGGAATGGKAAGTGGSATGGKAAGTGGAAATGGKAGATGGSTSTGTCVRGQVKPSEVVFMGESFYAIAPQYNETRVEADAQAAGSLAAGAKYRNVAVSGQTMNYVLTTEWPAATQGGAVKVVIMDGGGIDAMTSSCSTCPGDFTTLLGKMATAGVQDVIYTRYPEPGNPPGSNTTLKANLDALMPKMQAVCDATTTPRCHWVDLRPVWVNGDTTDGLHPTQSGGNHVGDAIWAEMVKDCIAQ